MPEIKKLRDCTEIEQQATYKLYLTSFDYYDVDYNETKQRALIDTLLSTDWFDAFVYFNGDSPCGFCFFVKTYTSLHAGMAVRVEEMFVAPDFQNQGIGTQLVQRLIQHCEENKIAKINLDAETRGKGSLKFYQRLGFKQNEFFIPTARLVSIAES